MVAYHYLPDGTHIVFKRYFASKKQAKEWLDNDLEYVLEPVFNINPIYSVVTEKDFEKYVKPVFNTLMGKDLLNAFYCFKFHPKLTYFFCYKDKNKMPLCDYDKRYDEILKFNEEYSNRKIYTGDIIFNWEK